MTQALRPLAEDFFSAVLFFAVYAATDNLYAAVGVAIVAGLAQVARKMLGGRPVDPMQWMSLGLVVVLGGATILAQSPRLLMLKPSIVHFAIAGIMLRRGWMSRYLPPIARQNLPEGIVVVAGYAWAVLLALLALANVVVATYCDILTWAWFVGFGLLGAKAVAFIVQYLVFRTLIRRSLRAAVVPAGA